VVCLCFQAEDGIRGFHVTGVQTCALPICVDVPTSVSSLLTILHICKSGSGSVSGFSTSSQSSFTTMTYLSFTRLSKSGAVVEVRSEERRVGKEGRCGG